MLDYLNHEINEGDLIVCLAKFQLNLVFKKVLKCSQSRCYICGFDSQMNDKLNIGEYRASNCVISIGALKPGFVPKPSYLHCDEYDIIDNTIEIGEKVVYIETGHRYLCIGTVTKVFNSMCEIESHKGKTRRPKRNVLVIK